MEVSADQWRREYHQAHRQNDWPDEQFLFGEKVWIAAMRHVLRKGGPVESTIEPIVDKKNSEPE